MIHIYINKESIYFYNRICKILFYAIYNIHQNPGFLKNIPINIIYVHWCFDYAIIIFRKFVESFLKIMSLKYANSLSFIVFLFIV